MIGELDFGDIFYGTNYLGTENTFAQGEEEFFLSTIFYKGVTYAIFLLFLVIMSILIMNLLVSLTESKFRERILNTDFLKYNIMNNHKYFYTCNNLLLCIMILFDAEERQLWWVRRSNRKHSSKVTLSRFVICLEL